MHFEDCRNPHHFKAGTKFEDIFDLYNFEKELLGVFKDLGYEIKLQKMLSHGFDFATAKSLGKADVTI